MLENVFTVLVRHGRVLHGNLDREHMSMAGLRAVLRKEGMATVSKARYAILAEDGSGGVIPRSVRPA